MDSAVMQRTERVEDRYGPVAMAAMAVGGVLALIGSLLTWTTVRLGGPVAPLRPRQRPGRFGGIGAFRLHGLDTTAGRAVLALSIALILIAALAYLAYWFWLRLGAVAAGFVLSVITLVWSALALASPSSAFDTVGVRLSQRGIPVSAGAGVVLALIGSAVATVAAAAWLAANRDRWTGVRMRPAPSPAPAASEPVPPADEHPTTPLPPPTPGLAPE
jgi:hypothetical protein